MLKRILAALLCSSIAVVGLTSCGKEITIDTANSNDSSIDTQVSDIANFTAPEKGEQIIIMNIKDYGEVKIKLFPEYADKGVENFVELAKDGYYDGLTFHRVINDFMIQGGDPLGTGTGGESIWGSKFDGGTDPHLIHAAGALAYANSGSTATNGSQFYIVTGTVYQQAELDDFSSRSGVIFPEQATEIYTTVGGTPWLDGGYTVFGQVFDGLDKIFEIQKVATSQSDNKPLEEVIMESVKVAEYNGEQIRWNISDYTE